jgi:hypothetical protein
LIAVVAAVAFCWEGFRRGCWFARSLGLSTLRALSPCVCQDRGGLGVAEAASDLTLSVGLEIAESVCWVACWGKAVEVKAALLWWKAFVAEEAVACPIL